MQAAGSVARQLFCPWHAQFVESLNGLGSATAQHMVLVLSCKQNGFGSFLMCVLLQFAVARLMQHTACGVPLHYDAVDYALYFFCKPTASSTPYRSYASVLTPGVCTHAFYAVQYPYGCT
jgi:hypothetical protein